jgi:hypothetical protein
VTRGWERAQSHILQSDLPTVDICTIYLDCSSDKKMWSSPQVVKLVAGL